VPTTSPERASVTSDRRVLQCKSIERPPAIAASQGKPDFFCSSRDKPAMTHELFAYQSESGREAIGRRAFVLRAFALPHVAALLPAIAAVARAAPFRHMLTPGGFTMSVATTSCGRLGWTSDPSGYRYTVTDPDTGQPWPAMPAAFRHLARDAAAASGFDAFEPDACLLNRYLPGARLSLHQDRDERDLTAPIVSISLGMPAVFLFGGNRRTDRTIRIPLLHGDVVAWGGEDRLRYHGVLALHDKPHPQLGSQRINLTFRKAG
jgi:alkylated DNA repair protein (DNA oxidative demethylase)